MSNITLGDLPTLKLCRKLSMAVFDTAPKNLDVLEFVNALEPYQRHIEKEKDKLLEMYGTPCKDKPGVYAVAADSDYHKKIAELLACPITTNIPDPGLCKEDFRTCTYPDPQKKEYQFSAADMNTILTFRQKILEEE